MQVAKPHSSVAWKSLALLATLGIAATASAADEADPKFFETHKSWPYPISIPKSQQAELEESAQRLAKVFDVKGQTTGDHFIWVAEENPVCCLRLRIDPWTPNPGQAGYVILIQPGGAIVTAVDLKQMDAAIDRLEKIRTIKDGQVYLPIGLITNYRVVAEP